MSVTEKPMLTRPPHRWARRDHETLLSSITKYTKFVIFSKMFLATLSLLMIVTIIILPVINADEEGLRIAFSTMKDKTESLPMMTKPSFQGVDENNQPYLVTADSALQHDERTIILNKVQADIMTDNKTWLSVKAAKGTIDTTAKTMQLAGNVALMHQDGYEFRTESVDIDMNVHIAQGTHEISGFGPMGDIRADRFSWHHSDRVMRFEGNVQMKVLPNG